MRSQRLKAQFGLLAAVIVLLASLGVLMNQSGSDRANGVGSTAAPAVLTGQNVSPPQASPISLSAPAEDQGVATQH